MKIQAKVTPKFNLINRGIQNRHYVQQKNRVHRNILNTGISADQINILHQW